MLWPWSGCADVSRLECPLDLRSVVEVEMVVNKGCIVLASMVLAGSGTSSRRQGAFAPGMLLRSLSSVRESWRFRVECVGEEVVWAS